MGLLGRRTGAALAACVLACVLPSFATAAKPARVQAPIAIAVNGEELPRDPSPRIVGKGGGRLVVPVVRIYSALGIAVSRSGKAITASAPGKRIVLTIGSANATIDGRPVRMEAPAMTIDGATYVPLRFVATSLGAQATFNAKANRVEVVSSLVGRNPSLEQPGAGGASQVVGSVSAVDLNSSPESLTVERGGNVRTVAITSEAKIELQDVVARTTMPAALTDVHIGDAVSVIVLHNGHVDSVIVRYASSIGTIAAVSSSQFVLNTGFIVTPDKSTTISLNAEPATLDDLKIGDAVVVRLNPDTNEKRQIIVSRAAAATSAPAGPVTISSFTIDAQRPLRAGDAFNLALRGTPGGRATFDIGSYLTGLPLNETQSGLYTAHYTIPPNVNFGQTTVYAHLSAGGAAAPRAEAPSLLAVSSTPPQIVDIAPLNGQSVNNDRPSIYATFRAPTGVGINPSSATISVNGLDVTPSSTRTGQFITYSPGVALADGNVTIAVRVADEAGNQQTRTWSFTIHAH
jgi:copper amine oxidase-like protein